MPRVKESALPFYAERIKQDAMAMGQRALGAGELGASMLTGLLNLPRAGWDTLMVGSTPEGQRPMGIRGPNGWQPSLMGEDPMTASEAFERRMSQGYQPRTQAGQEAGQVAGAAMEGLLGPVREKVDYGLMKGVEMGIPPELMAGGLAAGLTALELMPGPGGKLQKSAGWKNLSPQKQRELVGVASKHDPTMLSKAAVGLDMGARPGLSPDFWNQPPGLLSQGMGRSQRGGPAYHGTPHRFDEFKLSDETIGTGEGAQAYGHGLYFAENPGVAGSYRDAMSGTLTVDVPGNPSNRVTNFVADYLDDTGGITDDALNQLKKEAALEADRKVIYHSSGYVKEAKNFDIDPGPGWYSIRSDGKGLTGPYRDEFAAGNVNVLDFEDMAAINALKVDDIKVSKGHLYEVDIPDEAIDKMLDWDKPLSEQPELAKLADEIGGNITQKMLSEADRIGVSPTANNLYASLAQDLGGQEIASAALAQRGIPGIRYLDGSSRNKGKGTRNLVLFDTDIIKQTKRDGEIVSGGLAESVKPKPKPGDVVHIVLLDHAENSKDALEFEVYGKLFEITKSAFKVRVWGYVNDVDRATDNNTDNEHHYTIVKRAINSIKVLK